MQYLFDCFNIIIVVIINFNHFSHQSSIAALLSPRHRPSLQRNYRLSQRCFRRYREGILNFHLHRLGTLQFTHVLDLKLQVGTHR